MDKTRILTGELLVSKGALKINSSLPEVGLKDTAPNGSWLQQKQIQAALEARKHLIEVERIEKSGVLSHAEWCEELMIAEVTQKVGGYWQYLGHNVGKKLYLKPEEALFLLEVNCLLLKYNGVKVSLQQAYALLLRSKITLMQYQVYASLSRLGYRVFRHQVQQQSEPTEYEKRNSACSSKDNDNVVHERNSSPTFAEVINSACSSKTKRNSASRENNDVVYESNSSPTFAEVINSACSSKTKRNSASRENNDVVHESNSLPTFAEVINSACSSKTKRNSASRENNDVVHESNPLPTFAEVINSACSSNTKRNSASRENNDVVHESNSLPTFAGVINSACSLKTKRNSASRESNDVVHESNSLPTFAEVINSACSSRHISNSASRESNDVVHESNSLPTFSEVINSACSSKTKRNSASRENNDVAHESNSSPTFAEVINSACSSRHISNSASPENNDVVHKRSSSIFAEVNIVQEVDLSNNNVSEIEKVDTTPQFSKSTPDIQTHVDSKNLNQSKSLKDINQTVVSEQASTSGNSKKPDMKVNKLKSSKYIQHKINKLKCRKLMSKKCNMSNDYFENIPEFTKNSIVQISAPDRRYLPGKVYLTNNSYCINVEKIQTKSPATAPEDIPTTSTSSDFISSVYQNNANHLRHPPNPHPYAPNPHPHSYRGSNWTEFFNFRFSSHPHLFRHFNFWRPQTSLNYFQLNMSFQRPFIYPQFGQRLIQNPFLQPFMADLTQDVSLSSNNNTQRKKRTRDHLKQEHYASIQRLATLVKNSILELRLSDHNVSKLNHLIQTYNTRYKTRLRLSDDFTVINDENIIDTIEVDDDDEQTAKKVKRDQNPDAFNDKLQKFKLLAFQFKNLEAKNEATSRHRRMFSNLIKVFNKSYNVDYHVNAHFDVINRNDLTILSSSDSERVVKTSCAPTTSKKLKNPFSILKKLSEKRSEKEKHAVFATNSTKEFPFRYSEITVKTFKKEWLPDKSDFGRAEIVSKDFASEVIDIRREEFLFDFMKFQPDKFNNWLDVKISFLQCLQETWELFHYDEREKKTGLQSLVKPEEFNDALVLKKLSIFKNHKTAYADGNLMIDFDVYNRNVKYFKKSNRPLPHFRVICIRESSRMPSGADIESLHSMYKDGVTIVFAVVGTGSISYIQVNPVDLPIYISSTSNTVS